MFATFTGDPRVAARVDKNYHGHQQEAEYHVGRESKMRKLLADMEANPEFFEEETRIDDELDKTPELTVKNGSYGFVPNKDIPVVAHITYAIHPPPSKPSKGVWSTLQIILWLFAGGFILFGFATAYMANNFGRAAEILQRQENQCVVTTRRGEPISVRMYGETLFYDKRGEIVIPDIREVRSEERRAYERPFEECQVVAIDGVKPTDYKIRRF